MQLEFKAATLAVFFITMANAEAEMIPHAFDELRCRDSINAQLLELKAQGLWDKQAIGTDGQPYRSRTAVFGRWVELVLRDKREADLYSVTNFKTEKWTWDSGCKATRKELPGLNFKTQNQDPMARMVGDLELKNTMARLKNGLIYLWSPGLVYSVDNYQAVTKVAAKMNLAVITLADPRSDLRRTRNIAEKRGMPKSPAQLNSVELYMRNATVHFPTMILFRNGEILDPLIVGAYSPEALTAEIIKRVGPK